MIRRRTSIPAAVCVTTLVAVAVLPATAASAAGKKYLGVNYTVTGTSTVAKTGSTIKLGPATLKSKLYPNATFTGSLPLPPTTSSFKIAGLIPVTATVNFIQVGKVTGSIKEKKDKTIVTSKAKDYLRLSNVKTAGIPTPVGSNCETADPIAINVATPSGKSFNVNKGGKITGVFTIGDFANCGLTTVLINALIPGDGNTITLKLADPKIVSD